MGKTSTDSQSIVISGKVIEKTTKLVIIQSKNCKLEIKKGYIKSPAFDDIKKGKEATITLKKNAKINASMPLDEMIGTKKKDKKVKAGFGGFCRCDCFCS